MARRSLPRPPRLRHRRNRSLLTPARHSWLMGSPSNTPAPTRRRTRSRLGCRCRRQPAKATTHSRRESRRLPLPPSSSLPSPFARTRLQLLRAEPSNTRPTTTHNPQRTTDPVRGRSAKTGPCANLLHYCMRTSCACQVSSGTRQGTSRGKLNACAGGLGRAAPGSSRVGGRPRFRLRPRAAVLRRRRASMRPEGLGRAASAVRGRVCRAARR